MVVAFARRDEQQQAFPGFPCQVPDFSQAAVRDVFVPLAGAIEADVFNARQLSEPARHARLMALLERWKAVEHEVQRQTDLIGVELNLMGKDS